MAVQSASDYKFSSADTFKAMTPASEMSRAAFTTEGYDVTIYRDMEKAAPAWLALEEHADGLPYQRFGWIEAWHAAVGRDRQIEPVLVIARLYNAFAFMSAKYDPGRGPGRRAMLGPAERKHFERETFLKGQDTKRGTPF